MTPERWAELREILGEALELESEAREAFLTRRCQDDDALRLELEALIAPLAQDSSFLESPVLSQLAQRNREDSELEGAGDLEGGVADSEGRPRGSGRSFIGRSFGPYRVVAELGHGGMGIVCLAERIDDHYHKPVALKLIRPGLAPGALWQRFRRERQILANLEHPNVAHLLDGGTSADGLPYLVMEYVNGQPIDQWCQSGRLSIEARLELFLQVCAAVQHAHQHLVIHRDLKPSNILVTEAGVPKLLDFGIAKVIETVPEQDFTALTGTQQRATTPLYASPEQVQGLAPTTSTDVYSLGVILYELLTEKRPYELKSSAPAELVRVVCVEEVPRMSERVSAPRHKKRLKGDLDSILARALRKEPAHRYQTVEQLADELRCHLKGLPIVARQGHWRYRTAKFIRRTSRCSERSLL